MSKSRCIITRVSEETYSFLTGVGADMLITVHYSETVSRSIKRRIMRDYCRRNDYRLMRARVIGSQSATWVCASR